MKGDAPDLEIYSQSDDLENRVAVQDKKMPIHGILSCGSAFSLHITAQFTVYFIHLLLR